MPVAAADRASRDAARVLALALPADALLYVLLPLHHEAFGISLAEAGLLLAANRLVRIAGYGWVGRFFARHGPRRTCEIGVAGAVLAALGYVGLSGVWALLPSRLIWGLSFAGFNLATQALATVDPAHSARRSGRSRSVISMGPLAALLAGAALAQSIGARPTFAVLAVVALLALPFARRLPTHAADVAEVGPAAHASEAANAANAANAASADRTHRPRPAPLPLTGPRFALPTRLDTWMFVQGLTLEGVFVFGLAVMAGQALPDQAAQATAFVLALRYAAEIVLGPAGGAAAQRWGARRTLVALSMGSAAALALVGAGWLWTGATIVVLLRALLQPLPPPIAAADHPGDGRVPALARLATWRDIGAGLGPIAAGLLVPVASQGLLYGGCAAVVAAMTVAVALPGRAPHGSA